MKILLINNYFCNLGGAENSTYRTGRLLEDKGHKVYYFASDKGPLFETKYQYKAFFPKFDVSPMERFIRSYYNFRAEHNLDKYLKKIKPDIIHCNNIFYLLSPSIINSCRKNKIPVIITLRDSSFFCPANTLMIKNKEYCSEKLCLSKNPVYCILNKCVNNKFLTSLRYASVFWFYKNLDFFKNINKVICTSIATYNLALEFGISETKLEIVNNFIGQFGASFLPIYFSKTYNSSAFSPYILINQINMAQTCGKLRWYQFRNIVNHI